MTVVNFYCPYCGQRISIDDKTEPFGKKKKCKECEKIFILSSKTQSLQQKKQENIIIEESEEIQNPPEPDTSESSELKEKASAPSDMSKDSKGFRLFVALFVLFFFLVALGVICSYISEAYELIRDYTWEKTPCRIICSQVRESQEPSEQYSPYSLDIRYQYTSDGMSYTGQRYQQNESGSLYYAEIQRVVEQYPLDMQSICYVNPRHLFEAILARRSPGMILWIFMKILIAFIFVFIAARGFYSLWKRKNFTEIMDVSGFVVLDIVALVLLMGGVQLFYEYLGPKFKTWNAKSWSKTPCTVISAQIRIIPSEDPVYRLDILYGYSFKGREYKSNCYSFNTELDYGIKNPHKTITRYEPGTHTVCYVNPNDPLEAVLKKESGTTLTLAFIGVLLMAVGTGGICFFSHRVITLLKKPQVLEKERISSMPKAPVYIDGYITLSPLSTPKKRFLQALGFTILWNGILVVFFLIIWKQGSQDFGLLVILSAFALGGIFLIFNTFANIPYLFSPKVIFRASSDRVKAGGSLKVKWKFSGHVRVIRNCRLYLECLKETTYPERGGFEGEVTYRTDIKLLGFIEATSIKNDWNTMSGNGRLDIPHDVWPSRKIPSLTVEDCKIYWILNLEADIEWKAKIAEQYNIIVLPGE